MFHRRPSGISTLEGASGNSLAKLYALEGAARAMLVGIVPLIALQALGSKEAVSWIYLAAAVFTMTVTLNFSVLERLLQRRWVLTLGGLFIICASFLFYFADGWLFALAIGLRSAAASIFSVCLSLYIMEFINKADLTWTESSRVAFGGVAWLIGPTLGLWLWSNTSEVSPFILAAVLALPCILFCPRRHDAGSGIRCAYFAKTAIVSVLVVANPRRTVGSTGIMNLSNLTPDPGILLQNQKHGSH